MTSMPAGPHPTFCVPAGPPPIPVPYRDPDLQSTQREKILLVTTETVAGMTHDVVALIMSSATSRDLDSALHQAAQNLLDQACEVGADAVVAVQHQTSVSVDDPTRVPRVFVTMAGTAVRLPWPAGHADPTGR